MGAAMVAYAALIAWTGHITMSSKHGPAHTYTGSEALPWATLTACFGLALFGPLFARPTLIASWMSVWLVAGIAIVLVPAYSP